MSSFAMHMKEASCIRYTIDLEVCVVLRKRVEEHATVRVIGPLLRNIPKVLQHDCVIFGDGRNGSPHRTLGVRFHLGKREYF